MAGLADIISGKGHAFLSWLNNLLLREDKRWRPVFILLIISLFAWFTVGIFYRVALSFLELPALEVMPQNKGAAPPVAGGAGTSLVYRGIYERNLFGATEQIWQGEAQPAPKTTPTAGPPPPPPVPLPTQVLELKGTVAGDRLSAFAAIRERGKPADALYKVGDMVAGATIIEIRRSEILLEFGGEILTLKMVSSPLAPLLPERAGGTPAVPPPVATAPSPPLPAGRITITRAEVASQLSDMGGLLTQAQIRPFFQAGVPDGFMLSQLRPGSIYEKMNLRDGDIIQEVNNRRLRGAEDMIEFYNLLKGAPTVTLKLLREGRVETINYDLR